MTIPELEFKLTPLQAEQLIQLRDARCLPGTGSSLGLPLRMARKLDSLGLAKMTGRTSQITWLGALVVSQFKTNPQRGNFSTAVVYLAYRNNGCQIDDCGSMASDYCREQMQDEAPEFVTLGRPLRSQGSKYRRDVFTEDGEFKSEKSHNFACLEGHRMADPVPAFNGYVDDDIPF